MVLKGRIRAIGSYNGLYDCLMGNYDSTKEKNEIENEEVPDSNKNHDVASKSTENGTESPKIPGNNQLQEEVFQSFLECLF